MFGLRKNGTASYYIGRSRSGKTLLAQKLILEKKPKRAVIWDASGQWYAACQILGYQPKQVAGISNLAEQLMSDKDGIYCYSTSPLGNAKEEFEFFCGASFLYIMQSPAVVVVEELAGVSNASAPPAKWQSLQNQSQKYGGHLHTIIQRAQEGDKTTMTQATDVYLLQTADNDIAYINSAFGIANNQVPKEQLQALHIDRKGAKSMMKITPDTATNIPTKAKLSTKNL